MIENYIGTSERVELHVYVNGSRVQPDPSDAVIASVYDGTDLLYAYTASDDEISLSASDDPRHPYYYFETDVEAGGMTSRARTLRAEWEWLINGVSMARTDHIDVVQPLVSIDEIKQEFPQFAEGGSSPKTVDELKAMERTVRNVIETYCQQKFRLKVNETRKVFSTGGDSLHLPERLNKLISVTYNDAVFFNRYVSGDDIPSGSAIGDIKTEIVTWNAASSYHVVRKFARGVPFPVRADVSAELLGTSGLFTTGAYYDVTADWGWGYVPNEVNQAAKLLIGTYFCQDNAYHQRGINIVRSADWRMEFAKDPFETTGNTVADQLLSKFIQVHLAVL